MEKQEFHERYEASDALMETVQDRQGFITDIKSRLFNQIFHSVNSRFRLDKVVIVNKFDTVRREYEYITEFVLRTTVFYNVEDLLV